MYQEGSAVRTFTQDTQAETVAQPTPARRLRVHEGDALDARERSGVDGAFVRRVRYCLLALGILLVLGVARVAICCNTVAALSANQSLRAEVTQAQDEAGELRIENSVLSNTTRVTRIATENYGMVYAGAGETLDVAVPAQ